MDNKRKDTFLLILVSSFAITFLTYLIFLQMHYSVDSYCEYFRKETLLQLYATRYVNYVIGEFCLRFGINLVKTQGIFSMVLILTISYCISKITKLAIENYRVEASNRLKLSIFVMVSFGFINVFIVELFLYPEMTLYYSLSLFFAVKAVEELLNTELRLRSGVKAFLYVTLSLFSYQSSLALVIIYFFVLMLIKDDFEISKNMIKEMCKGLLIPFASAVLCLICQKVVNLHQERFAVFDLGIIFNNIKALVIFQKELWVNQLGFWPSYVLLFVAALGFVGSILALIKRIISIKCLLTILLLLILGYVSVFAPHIISSSLWLVPRTMYGFWNVISGAFLIFLLLLYEKKPKNLTSLKISLACGLVVLTLGVGNVWGIGINHIRSNDHDRQYVYDILDCIWDYERQSGTEVKNIATCFDQNHQWSYPDINYYYGDTNSKCFNVAWGDVYAINYYSGKNYIKVEMPQEIINEHFANNWDTFLPGEQCYFKDDTLYLCIY